MTLTLSEKTSHDPHKAASPAPLPPSMPADLAPWASYLDKQAPEADCSIVAQTMTGRTPGGCWAARTTYQCRIDAGGGRLGDGSGDTPADAVADALADYRRSCAACDRSGGMGGDLWPNGA